MGRESDAFSPILRRFGVPRDGVLIVHSGIAQLSRQGFTAEGIIESLLDHAATDPAPNFDGDRVLRQPRSVRVPAGTAHRQVCGPVVARDGGASSEERDEAPARRSVVGLGGEEGLDCAVQDLHIGEAITLTWLEMFERERKNFVAD